MIRISDIKVSPGFDERKLKETVQKKYGIKNIKSFCIVKKSIDARKKNAVKIIYSADVKTENDKKYIGKNICEISQEKYCFPNCINKEKKVIIAGTGPAGLMCGLMLARAGINVIMLERGKCVEERKLDILNFFENGKLNENSNVQFGEGGAGTFSDGKLTTGINDFRIRKVLEEFYAHGAPEEIL